jgi:hypothetical protein
VLKAVDPSRERSSRVAFLEHICCGHDVHQRESRVVLAAVGILLMDAPLVACALACIPRTEIPGASLAAGRIALSARSME